MIQNHPKKVITMDLMTNEIEKKLTSADKYLRENEEAEIKEQPVIVKYFYPMGRYTFYAISGEKIDDDIILFGYCLSPLTPDFDELGYQSLNELKEIPLMERDLYSKLGVLGDYVHQQ